MQKTRAKWSTLRKLTLTLTLGALATLATQVTTADVYTEPVGFYKVTATNNSDTITSLAFLRVPEYQGLVASASGSTLSISNSPGWTAGQWATPNINAYFPYFVQIRSGSLQGAYYTITNNGSASLDVILNPETLSGVAAGDTIRIVPFWTLNTVFPGGTGIVASTTATAAGRRSQVLMPDQVTDGINLSASAIYFYFNNAWRRAGSPATSNFNDVVILPDQSFTLRQATNATDTTLYMAPGLVNSNLSRTPLYANPVASGLQQDNAVAIYRPSVQTLNESGLTNGFVASISAAAAGRRDQLLTFDNAVQAQNKSANAIYFFFNNGWRKVGSPATVDFGPTNVFTPGAGVIVRKATNDTATTIWVNSPNY